MTLGAGRAAGRVVQRRGAAVRAGVAGAVDLPAAARRAGRLFPDELFSDLYVQHGRRSVPPSILAVVTVLQRLEGCSDREACDQHQSVHLDYPDPDAQRDLNRWLPR